MDYWTFEKAAVCKLAGAMSDSLRFDPFLYPGNQEEYDRAQALWDKVITVLCEKLGAHDIEVEFDGAARGDRLFLTIYSRRQWHEASGNGYAFVSRYEVRANFIYGMVVEHLYTQIIHKATTWPDSYLLQEVVSWDASTIKDALLAEV